MGTTRDPNLENYPYRTKFEPNIATQELTPARPTKYIM